VKAWQEKLDPLVSIRVADPICENETISSCVFLHQILPGPLQFLLLDALFTPLFTLVLMLQKMLLASRGLLSIPLEPPCLLQLGYVPR